jgi:hypothetical protein
MVEPTSFFIVVLTARHSISGELRFTDLRLSDYLNDRRETTITLRNAQVARLDDPGKVIHKSEEAVIPKTWAIVAFEPPQQAIPPAKRFYGYVRKQTHQVFMVLEAMEVSGILHTTSDLDLRRLITSSTETFLPLTQAVVKLAVNDRYMIEQAAVMVNAHLIRYIGGMEELASNS